MDRPQSSSHSTMEVDSLSEAVMAEDSKVQEGIDREEAELDWMVSTSRLASHLGRQGFNCIHLLTAVRADNLPKDVMDKQVARQSGVRS